MPLLPQHRTANRNKNHNNNGRVNFNRQDAEAVLISLAMGLEMGEALRAEVWNKNRRSPAAEGGPFKPRTPPHTLRRNLRGTLAWTRVRGERIQDGRNKPCWNRRERMTTNPLPLDGSPKSERFLKPEIRIKINPFGVQWTLGILCLSGRVSRSEEGMEAEKMRMNKQVGSHLWTVS